MKTLVLILTVFIATNGIAQVKGDNSIIINKTVLFDDLKALFFINGYSFIGTDTNYISTTSKQLANDAVSIKFMIIKKDSVLLLKGLYKPTVSVQIWGVKSEDDFEQLYFGGMNKSPFRKAWNEMDRIAKLLANDVIYIKQ